MGFFCVILTEDISQKGKGAFRMLKGSTKNDKKNFYIFSPLIDTVI